MKAVLDESFQRTWETLVRAGITEVLCVHALEAPRWPTEPEQVAKIEPDVFALVRAYLRTTYALDKILDIN